MSLLARIEAERRRKSEVPGIDNEEDAWFGIESAAGASVVTVASSSPQDTIQVRTGLEEEESHFLEEDWSRTNLLEEEFIEQQEYILNLLRDKTEQLKIEEQNAEQLKISLIELVRRNDKDKRVREENLHVLITSLVNDMKGYGPIQEFMDDPNVTDIRIIGDKCIRYKIRGRYHESSKPEHRFRNETHLLSWINRKITLSRMGGRFDKGVARANALLPDGSRLHAITQVSGVDEERDGKRIPTPYTIVSIRKFAKKFTMEELASKEYQLNQERQDEWNELLQQYENIKESDLYQKNRFMNTLIMAYLHLISRLRFTTLFAGGMGTGKTTTLSALFPFIPYYHVCGILDEVPEMQPEHEQTIRLWERPENTEEKGAITMEDLMKEILRMDVNRFFISELRDRIAYLFLQGIINGHPGGGSTIHANSILAALLRLISLACAYPGSNRDDVLHMIVEGIQTIIHIEKTDDDEKYINEIAEVVDLKDGEIVTTPVFTVEFSPEGNWSWRFHGLSERVRQEAKKARLTIPSILLEPREAFPSVEKLGDIA